MVELILILHVICLFVLLIIGWKVVKKNVKHTNSLPQKGEKYCLIESTEEYQDPFDDPIKKVTVTINDVRENKYGYFYIQYFFGDTARILHTLEMNDFLRRYDKIN